MTIRLRAAVLVPIALALVLALSACQPSAAPSGADAGADEAPGYLPSDGDQAIVFTHLYTPEDYDEAARLTIEEFSAAIDEHGEKRRTYWLENRENHELIAVSFFHSESDVDSWMNSGPREEVLEILEPMRREPIRIVQYEVHSAHDSP